MIIRISPSDPTSNLPADNEEAKALWQQQTSRFRLIQMFSRMQQMQCRPAIRNFVAVGQSSTTRRVREYGMTRWPAKIYGDAIRWSFWDGKSSIIFTGDAEDFRHAPFELSLSMRNSVKREL